MNCDMEHVTSDRILLTFVFIFIGVSIRTRQVIQCLLYAGFFFLYQNIEPNIPAQFAPKRNSSHEPILRI